jgi:hypothetical protein
MTMPSGQLKRAELSMQTIRDQGELPPETADALQELVDVIRASKGAWRRSKAKGMRTARMRWTCQTRNEQPSGRRWLWPHSNERFVPATELLIFIYVSPGVFLALPTGAGYIL